MVKLVDHDVVVIVRRSGLFQLPRVKGLHRDKQRVQPLRAVVSHEQVAEIQVFQYAAKTFHTLLQDLFAMGHKQQPIGPAGIFAAKPFVIQRRNHRLAGSGRGHQQILIVAADFALGLQLVQNLLLIGIGMNVKQKGRRRIRPGSPFGLQRRRQSVSLLFAIIFKLLRVPVAFKSVLDFSNRIRQILGRNLDVPLQTAGNRRVGKIRRTHVGRRKASFTIEHIGFCVQAGSLGLIGNLDFALCQFAQLFDRLDIGRAHIGGGDDAELSAVAAELAQFVHDHAQAAPLDKRNQQVDPVTGGDFFFQLRKQARFVAGPGEQRADRQRRLWPDELGPFVDGQGVVLSLEQGQQLFCGLRHRKLSQARFLGFLFQPGDQLVDKQDLIGQTAAIFITVQAVLDNLRQILRQHFCRLGSVKRR